MKALYMLYYLTKNTDQSDFTIDFEIMNTKIMTDRPTSQKE